MLRAESIERFRQAARNIEEAIVQLDVPPNPITWRWTTMATLIVSAIFAVFLVYTCVRTCISIKSPNNYAIPVYAVTSNFIPDQMDELIRRCLRQFVAAFHVYMAATQPIFDIEQQATPRIVPGATSLTPSILSRSSTLSMTQSALPTYAQAVQGDVNPDMDKQ